MLVAGALTHAFWQADRWVVIVGTGESVRAHAVDAWLGVFATRRLADQAVGRAVRLLSAWG